MASRIVIARRLCTAMMLLAAICLILMEIVPTVFIPVLWVGVAVGGFALIMATFIYESNPKEGNFFSTAFGIAAIFLAVFNLLPK